MYIYDIITETVVEFYYIVSSTGNIECYLIDNGSDYRGYKSTTTDDYTCQKWTAQSPHAHTYTTANYPTAGIGDHNYCRNPEPNLNAVQPWCLTVDPQKRWQYCDVGEAQTDCFVGRFAMSIHSIA